MCSTKESEDEYLAGCMQATQAKHVKVNAERNRQKLWTYSVIYDGDLEFIICKKCFLGIFKVRKYN